MTCKKITDKVIAGGNSKFFKIIFLLQKVQTNFKIRRLENRFTIVWRAPMISIAKH